MAAQHSLGDLLAIGGSEDRAGGSGPLRAFAELCGGAAARIVLITTASGTPGDSFASYSAAFGRLGVPVVRELRLARREQADGVRLPRLSAGDSFRLHQRRPERANHRPFG